MPELTQNEYGRWKLKGVHHDFPGVTIHARYTYPYYKGQTEEFDITDQPGEDRLTKWETELGTPIISTVTADEIRKEYDECICGDTKYVVTNHEFQVVPYDVPEPSVSINSDKITVPYVGTEDERTAHVYITVTHGTFSGYTLSDQNIATASLERLSDTEARLTLVFNAGVGATETRTLYVTGYGTNGSKTSSAETSIQQTKNWSLSDVDYVIFTYEWGEEDGRDLDSFTFIDGLATGGSPSDWCHEYFEKGVGYDNGKLYNPGGTVKDEKYLGNEYKNSVIKFAGDNTESGGEYTLIDFKKLNEYVEEGINNGQLQPDGKIVIYLMGCWYNTRGDGLASASFIAYKGGEVYRETIEETQYSGKYKYSVSGDTEVKGTKEVTGINVFSARLNSLDNSLEALKTYTTMAAFVYDYSTSTFFLETDPEEIAKITPNRYNYGLQLSYSGKIQITGSKVLEREFSINPTIKIDVDQSYIQNERNYRFDFSQVQLSAVSGDSPNSPVSCRVEFDSCKTVDSSSTQYDGLIHLQYLNNHSFEVTVPAGHIYSGSYSDGYSAFYHLIQPNEFMELVVKRNRDVGEPGCFKVDLCETEH